MVKTERPFWIGIDYGSKLAGTTVIAVLEKDDTISLYKSKKKEDADAMIIEVLQSYPNSIIGLDAPLSLPGIYTKIEDAENYFYRACDMALNAMSPMFIGGLTARAMKLKATLKARNIYEVYPAALAKLWKLHEHGYKKELENIKPVMSLIADFCKRDLPAQINTWHEIDAILALCSVERYCDKNAAVFGNSEEGIIIV